MTNFNGMTTLEMLSRNANNM